MTHVGAFLAGVAVTALIVVGIVARLRITLDPS